MIESLLSKPTNAPYIPPLGDTIFLMKDFATLADIKDKGPLSVPVTKGSALTVGSNPNGTFINFPGSDWNSVLNFASSLLNCTEAEVNLIISDVNTTGGIYGAAIIDTRPPSTNGNYFTFGINTTGSNPRYAGFTINNSTIYSPQAYAANLFLTIKIRLLKDRSQMYINNVLVAESTTLKMTGISNQTWGIGRSAYQGINGVMPLVAKVYFFEIRKIS